jgi:predicted amidophosphoribosyltransferase
VAAPPRCAACGGPRAPEPALCAVCDEELGVGAPLFEPGPPGLDSLVAPWEFEGAARRLVHGLKYGRRLGLAEHAAEAIAEAVSGPAEAAVLAGAEALVAVPPSPLRRLWRGFDPAEEIALALAQRLGLPPLRCLARRHGPRQVGRPRSARLADPPRVRTRGQVPGVALLVDDVCTTGATLAACAWALRDAGCSRVVALVAARADLSRGGGGRTMSSPPRGGDREDRCARPERRGDG